MRRRTRFMALAILTFVLAASGTCFVENGEADQGDVAPMHLEGPHGRVVFAWVPDDLARDREAQSRMGAEPLARRPVGIEPVEDLLQVLRRDAGAAILDLEHDARPVAACASVKGPACAWEATAATALATTATTRTT